MDGLQTNVTMIRTIFILLLPTFCMAQSPTVAYTLDTLAKDSFFLMETVTRPMSGSPRPQELTTSLLFRDTSELTAYVVGLKQQLAEMNTRIAHITGERDFLAAKIHVISGLQDSVFFKSGGVDDRSALPPPMQNVKAASQPKQPAQKPKKAKKKN